MTGLLLPSFKFVSVPSRTNYWAQTQRAYPETKIPSQPASNAIEWSAEDDERLSHLVDAIIQRANTVLLELQSEPEFANLPTRKQVKLISEKVGTGIFGTLWHIARLNQLNGESARKVLKSSETLSTVLRKLEE